MKRHLLLLIVVFCLPASAGFAQNVQPNQSTNPPTHQPESWRPLLNNGLTGASFKILPAVAYPKLMLGPSAGITFRPPATSWFNEPAFAQVSQSLYRQPELLIQLHEQLGGEFWFGTPSQPGAFSNGQATAERSLGLRAIVPLGRNWAASAGASKSRYSASASFPVTVFAPQNGQTKQLQGNAHTEIAGFQTDASARFYLSGLGALRPFAGAGLAYYRRSSDNWEVKIQEVAWTAGAKTSNSGFKGILQAGLAIQPPSWPIFAEIGAGAWLPGGSWSVTCTAGWKI